MKIISLLLLLVVSQTVLAQKADSKKVWKDAEKQLTYLLQEARAQRNNQRVFPRTIEQDSLRVVNSDDWTSGFFPGMLWLMYEQTGKLEWKAAAQEFTSLMHREPTNGNSHDIGFKVYNSYGHGYRLTKDTAYKSLVIQAAKTLTTRFNPTVGLIKSWDLNKWKYPVIIDNMMNLELLFAATRFTGDSTYYNIAVTHANTTMKHHFRANNTTYHVVDFDAASGAVKSKITAQGYADESAWARGQAWALYGYTMCYRETKNRAYLDQAEKIAAFIINNATTDGIPYWDYNVPDKQTASRDASAAAITASALYELNTHSKNTNSYKRMADKILNSLIASYRSPVGANHGFLLLHSTGHKPANSEVDVPIIYADYYYMEALNRSKGKGK